jgi:hypothetical protein
VYGRIVDAKRGNAKNFSRLAVRSLRAAVSSAPEGGSSESGAGAGYTEVKRERVMAEAAVLDDERSARKRYMALVAQVSVELDSSGDGDGVPGEL